MRRAPAGWIVAALAAACPAAAPAAYDDIAGLRATLGPVRLVTAEALGAKGDDRADDTAALQAGLDRPGAVVVLAPGRVYRLGRSLLLRGGGGIVGHGEKPGRLHLPAGSFGCDTRAGCTRYFDDPTAVGLAIFGRPDDPAGALRGVVLDNFAIRGDGPAQQGRTMMAIACRNVRDLRITRLDIANLANAMGIRCSGVTGRSLIGRNHIHDFADNSAFPIPNLMTGIAIENDSAVASDGVRIVGNRIARLLYGPAFVARFDQQSSGIVTIGGAQRIVAEGNIVEDVGQGVDWHTSDGRIAGNIVRRAALFCIKLIHGASRNAVAGNRLDGCGIGGISLGGGNNNAPVAANRISGNSIAGIDYDGRHAGASSTAVFWLGESSSQFHAVGNRIGANKVDPGNAKWIVADDDAGNRDNAAAGLTIARDGRSGRFFSRSRTLRTR